MRFIAEQLSAEEAASVFTADGGLQPGVIQNAEEVIPGSELNNPAVIQELTKGGSRIADWGKYKTETFHSPGRKFFAGAVLLQ